jgi:sulfate permease, SulP family
MKGVPFRRILVALAHREADSDLLRYACMVQGLLHPAEVLCLHVDAEEMADPENLRREFASEVAVVLPQAQSLVTAGDVLDSILSIAAEHGTDLILVGHASHSRRRSLARRVAMTAPCSVWMVPDSHPAVLQRILVPFDFSRVSADTLSEATAIAEAAGLDECLAVHVDFNEALATFDEFDDILAENRDRAYGLFIAPIDLHGVWVKPRFIDSAHVAQTVVRTAMEERCDLIVMGTRGRSPSAAVLLGSETEHCMMTTPVPLLAVKHFGARLSLREAMRDQRVRQRGDDRFT